MDEKDIDLLNTDEKLGKPKSSPILFFSKKIILLLIVLATVGSVFSYQVSSTSDSTGNVKKLSLLSTLKQFVHSHDRKIDGETKDRINLLFLGVGGPGHSGPQLSDTIIFASYKPTEKKIGMMSLPRDMSVPIPGYGYRKVNHANAYGESDAYGTGPVLASEVIGNVLNKKINYYLRVDFDGFAEFINDIGGVDVYVENAFTDPTYPTHGREFDDCGYKLSEKEHDTEEEFPLKNNSEILNNEIVEEKIVPDFSCRFETLSFKEGWTHMDGETALKFVRSRHGNNGEGSDFARSRRQQKILWAVKDKLFSASTFLNPSRIKNIMHTLEKNIATNMDVWEIIRLAKQIKKIEIDDVAHHVIDSSDDSPLYATSLNGSYVLLPKNDDWVPLQTIADQIFTPASKYVAINNVTEKKPHFVKVEIQNGTNITGLAFLTSQLLDEQGFDVTKIGNAKTRGYKHTVVYDLTDGQKTKELKALRDFLEADVTLSATGWMINGDVVPKEISLTTDSSKQLTTKDNVDFLVILGENSSSLAKK